MGLAVALGCEVEQPLYITDQLEMEELMRHNIELNGLKSRVKSAILNWYVPHPYFFVPSFFLVTLDPCVPTRLGSRDESREKSGGGAEKKNVLTTTFSFGRSRGETLSEEIVDFKPDTILAADCVYFEPAFPLLLATLGDLLELSPSATIYFCFKKRRRADMQFLKSAKKAFTVTEIDDDDRPVFSREGLFLYSFTRK